MAKGIGWELTCLFEEPDYYGAAAKILFELIPETFFWASVGLVENGDLVKKTAAAFKKAVTSQHRQWKLVSSREDPAVELECHRLGPSMSLRLMLMDDAWSELGADVSATIEALSWQVMKALRGSAFFSTDSGVFTAFDPDLEYERAKPVPSNRLFRFDMVADMLDRRMVKAWTRDAQPEHAAAVEKVCAAPVPKGVRRTEDGDQIVLVWTDAMHQRASLIKALSAHEHWLAKALIGKAR